jgi:hypothetical protein
VANYLFPLIMLIPIRIPQHFKNFQHMRFVEAFEVSLTHCGKLAVQRDVLARSGAGVVVPQVYII